MDVGITDTGAEVMEEGLTEEGTTVGDGEYHVELCY